MTSHLQRSHLCNHCAHFSPQGIWGESPSFKWSKYAYVRFGKIFQTRQVNEKKRRQTDITNLKSVFHELFPAPSSPLLFPLPDILSSSQVVQSHLLQHHRFIHPLCCLVLRLDLRPSRFSVSDPSIARRGRWLTEASVCCLEQR